MKSLDRKELFEKTKCSLVGEGIFIFILLILIGTIIFYIITKDIFVYLSIGTTLLYLIMLIFNNNILYFLDLILLKYKVTDIVIENTANGSIQGKHKTDYIGGYRKITCIDGKKINLKIYHEINVKIPDLKSEDKYKLVYLKYSKIIIDSIIVSSEVPKKDKNRKKRR